jgi:hypothetical protein
VGKGETMESSMMSDSLPAQNQLLQEIKFKLEETAWDVWRRFLYPNGQLFAEFTSYATFFGLPWLHYTRGKRPETGSESSRRGDCRWPIGLRGAGDWTCVARCDRHRPVSDRALFRPRSSLHASVCFWPTGFGRGRGYGAGGHRARGRGTGRVGALWACADRIRGRGVGHPRNRPGGKAVP